MKFFVLHLVAIVALSSLLTKDEGVEPKSAVPSDGPPPLTGSSPAQNTKVNELENALKNKPSKNGSKKERTLHQIRVKKPGCDDVKNSEEWVEDVRPLSAHHMGNSEEWVEHVEPYSTDEEPNYSDQDEIWDRSPGANHNELNLLIENLKAKIQETQDAQITLDADTYANISRFLKELFHFETLHYQHHFSDGDEGKIINQPMYEDETFEECQPGDPYCQEIQETNENNEEAGGGDVQAEWRRMRGTYYRSNQQTVRRHFISNSYKQSMNHLSRWRKRNLFGHRINRKALLSNARKMNRGFTKYASHGPTIGKRYRRRLDGETTEATITYEYVPNLILAVDRLNATYIDVFELMPLANSTSSSGVEKLSQKIENFAKLRNFSVRFSGIKQQLDKDITYIQTRSGHIQSQIERIIEFFGYSAKLKMIEAKKKPEDAVYDLKEKELNDRCQAVYTEFYSVGQYSNALLEANSDIATHTQNLVLSSNPDNPDCVIDNDSLNNVDVLIPYLSNYSFEIDQDLVKIKESFDSVEEDRKQISQLLEDLELIVEGKYVSNGSGIFTTGLTALLVAYLAAMWL